MTKSLRRYYLETVIVGGNHFWNSIHIFEQVYFQKFNLLHNVKLTVKISLNFVAFLENINFKELDYTAALIVDFSNLKQSCIILDTKSSIL